MRLRYDFDGCKIYVQHQALYTKDGWVHVVEKHQDNMIKNFYVGDRALHKFIETWEEMGAKNGQQQ